MSNGQNVASGYVDISVDLSKLVAGLAKTEALLADTMAKIDGRLSTVTPSASKLSTVVSGMFEGAGIAAFHAGLQGIEAGFSAAEDAVIGFNGRLEQSAIGWQTLLKNTGISAQSMLGDIQQIANATNFRFEGLEQDSKQLLAMGIAAKQVLPTMIDIGNVAAGLGLGADGIDIITRSIGQMNTATKVHAQDMMQLTSAGVPAWEILAKATGKSTAEVQRLSEQGKITADVFITAFREWSRANFGTAMAEQSHTFLGAVSTIEDSLQSAAAVGFKPLFEGISQLSQVIARLVQTNEFQAWVARVAVVVGQAVSDTRAFGSLVLDLFGIKLPDATDTTSTALAKYSKMVIESGTSTDKAGASLDDLKKQLSDAKDQYKVFADAAVTGSKGFADQLFAIGQQQAQANLDLLNIKAPGAGLDQLLKPIQSQIDTTSASVDDWKHKLDGATSAVDEQEYAVRGAQEALKGYDHAVQTTQREIDYHKDKISGLTDQYTELTDAIKAQQDALEGHRHEKLQGETALEKQIAAAELRVKEQLLRIAEAEQGGVGKKRLDQMNKELDALRNQADILRLQKETTYDVQHAQLEQQGVPVVETTFDQAKTAITNTQAWIDQLQSRVPAVKADLDTEEARLKDAEFRLKAGQAARDQQQAIVDQQQATLDHLKDTRDHINNSYTTEKDKLTELQKTYKTTETEALKPFEDAIKRLNDAASKTKLTEQLQLGPLRDQVNDVLHPIQEMSSDAIIAGLEATRKKIADIQAQIDKGNAPTSPSSGQGRRHGGEQDGLADVTAGLAATPTGIAGATQSFTNFGKAVDGVATSLTRFSDWMEKKFPGIAEQPTHLTDNMREARDTTEKSTLLMSIHWKDHAKNVLTFIGQMHDAGQWLWDKEFEIADWMEKNWGPSFERWQTTAEVNMSKFINKTLPGLYDTMKKDAGDVTGNLEAKWAGLWDEKNQGGILGSWIIGLGDLSTKTTNWLNDAAGNDGKSGWLFTTLNSWGDVMVNAWEDGVTTAWPNFMTFLSNQFAGLASLLPDWMKTMLGMTPGGPSGGGGSMWGGGQYNTDAINKILGSSGLAGEGATIARLAAQYNVPASLAIAMFRKEASFAAPGSLAAANNNPGNIKDPNGYYGGQVGAGGFRHYDTMEAGIEAYFKLLDREYRRYLDSGNIAGLVSQYAPSSDNNNVPQYVQEITDWIKEIAAAINVANGGTPGTVGNGITADDPRPSQAGINTVVPGAVLGDTFDADRGALGPHDGLDLQIKNGTPVHVPLDLTNVHVGYYSDEARRGYYVTGTDIFGREWYLGHLSAVYVKDGQSIRAGSTIGTVGMGHVHVQLKQGGHPIDPSAALDAAAQAAPSVPPQDTGSSYNGQSTGTGDIYTSDRYSIGGPNLPILAGNINGVTDAITGLLPAGSDLADLFKKIAGAAADAADGTAGLANATDDIYDHVKFIGGSTGVPGFKGPGYTSPGSGYGFTDPVFGDPIAAGTKATQALTDGVRAAEPDWMSIWQTVHDDSKTSMDGVVQVVQLAHDHMADILRDLVARINDAYNRANSLRNLSPRVPGLPGGGGDDNGGNTDIRYGNTVNNFYTRDSERAINRARSLGYRLK